MRCGMIKNNSLPEGFVYIRDIDSTIQQQLRYASTQNFVGTEIDGYQGKEAITTLAMARMLKIAQERFLALGYSIVIYDSYRPQKSVDHFRKWANDSSDLKMKSIYYPEVADKATLFDTGFIARKSSHTRGSAVDLTIIATKNKLKDTRNIDFIERILANGQRILYLDDGTIDMGSSFDLFDSCSGHGYESLEEFQLKNRLFLKNTMEDCGFTTYHKEWWHYSIENEPFPDTYFDFDIL